MTKIIARDSGGGDFEIPAAGSYIARCYKLVDIGTQEVTFQGKPSTPKRQLLAWFELLEDEDGEPYLTSDGRPFSVMQRYTLSTNPKATLRKHIDAWRGKPLTKKEAEEFDVGKLLGQSCRLQITVDDKGERSYVNVASIGFTKKEPEGVNELVSWSISEPDAEVYEKFPDWLRAKIQSAEEFSGLEESASGTKEVKAHISDKGEVIIEDIPDDDPIDVSKVKF